MPDSFELVSKIQIMKENELNYIYILNCVLTEYLVY